MSESSFYKSSIPNAVDARGLITKVYDEQIKPVVDQFGINLQIRPEKPAEMGMYEARVWWAFGTFEQERSCEGKSSGSITISNRANKELSDDALEGLICTEASRIILYHLASGIEPSAYPQIKNLAFPEQYVRFNAVQKALFNIDKLIPAESETANINYRYLNYRYHESACERWIHDFSQYLNALSKPMPGIATEIVRRIEFADELWLDAPL